MPKRLVIALVCDAIHPYSHGGREQRYHELARHLAVDFDVHVYTMNWWHGPPSYMDGGVTFHAISPFLPLYKKGRRSIKQAVVFALACLRLLKYDFDVLDADHMPYLQVFVLRLIAIFKQKPFIVTWHEVWSRSYWRSYLGPAGLFGWLAEWLAMRVSRAVITASPHTGERLAAALNRRTSIVVVPNGIDLAEVHSTPAAAEQVDIVAVGRLISHKRIDMLLDAIAMIHTRGMPVRCRVIGDGPDRDALHAQAQRLGIEHSVTFHHNVVEQKEVYALVKAADVFVSASAREGFGIAVLEAIACGLPVITTSAPDNLARHLAARSERGIICEPTPDALADAIQQLLAEQCPSSGPADQCDDWLADYDWNLLAQCVAKIYRQVAAAGTEPPA